MSRAKTRPSCRQGLAAPLARAASRAAASRRVRLPIWGDRRDRGQERGKRAPARDSCPAPRRAAPATLPKHARATRRAGSPRGRSGVAAASRAPSQAGSARPPAFRVCLCAPSRSAAARGRFFSTHSSGCSACGRSTSPTVRSQASARSSTPRSWSISGRSVISDRCASRRSDVSHQSRHRTSKCPIGSSKPFTAMVPPSKNRMPLPRQRSCTPEETTMPSG